MNATAYTKSVYINNKDKIMSKKPNKKIQNAVSKAIRSDDTPEELKDQKWEDLTELYKTISVGFIEMGQFLSNSLAIEGIIEYVEDQKRLDTLVKCVTDDITRMSVELRELYGRHENRTGYIKNEDELFEAISLFQEYQDLQSRIMSIVTPVHVEAIAMLHEAGRKMGIIDKKDKLDTAEEMENEIIDHIEQESEKLGLSNQEEDTNEKDTDTGDSDE